MLYHFNVDASTLTKIEDRAAHMGLLQTPTDVTLIRIAMARSMIWEIVLRYRIENGTNEGLITNASKCTPSSPLTVTSASGNPARIICSINPLSID